MPTPDQMPGAATGWADDVTLFEIAAAGRPIAKLLCGVDDLMLENVLFGATGWVSGLANSFPREAVQMLKHAEADRIDEAPKLYRWFMPMLHLDVAVKLVQYIELANQITGGGPSGSEHRA